MRAICVAAVFAVFVCLGGSLASRAQEDKDDAILGEWDIVGMVYKGAAQDFDGPTGGTVKVVEGKFLVQYPSFGGGPVIWLVTIRPSKSPRGIDVHGAGKVWPGIYELKGDTLRVIVCGVAAGDRPTSFEALKDTRLTLYTLKKSKQ